MQFLATQSKLHLSEFFAELKNNRCIVTRAWPFVKTYRQIFEDSASIKIYPIKIWYMIGCMSKI